MTTLYYNNDKSPCFGQVFHACQDRQFNQPDFKTVVRPSLQ
jgi:hypothetical protein